MKEAAEGEEAPEPTEEESEQGPEPLSTLDKDAEVEGGEAWTPLFSSTNSGVKNQVEHHAKCIPATSPQTAHPYMKHASITQALPECRLRLCALLSAHTRCINDLCLCLLMP